MKYFARIQETSSNTPGASGTVTVNLNGATSGHRTFIGAGRFATAETTIAHIRQTNDNTKWLTAEVTITDATPDTLTFVAADVIDGSAGAGVLVTWTSTVTAEVEPSAAQAQDLDRVLANFIPGGRLTLETGVPISTTDQTAKTTVYYTPFKGNSIPLYTGKRWKLMSFSEISIALGTLASASFPNDIFAYNNAGTVALEKLIWTSATARATAIVKQDGRYVKGGDATRLYLGTFIPTSTTTTEDSVVVLGLWNYYNRSNKAGTRSSSTSHVINGTTIREFNAGIATRVYFCIGVVEDPISLWARLTCSNTATNPILGGGVGVNGSAYNIGRWNPGAVVTVSLHSPTPAYSCAYPPLGVNYAHVMEVESASQAVSVDVGVVTVELYC